MEKEEIKKLWEDLPDVYNMTSPRGGEVPNQYVINGKDYSLFRSYNSPIALKKDGKVYIFKDWDRSTTTGKYRNSFLDEKKAVTMKKLKSGEYIAVDFEVVK